MEGAVDVGQDFDLVVLGSGAGGMTAALVAALDGLRPLLVEASERIGGTTALSSGTVWIPGNRHQHALGLHDDPQAARTYLDALVGDRAERALREAFLAAGPAMIDDLHERTDVRFHAYAASPDYRQDLPGAAQGGRPLEPLPFDGRTLGAEFDRLRWPLRELMLFGGMMVTRGEAVRLLRALRSAGAFALGARLVTRFARDRLRYARGTRLVLGNALAARLYRNLRERGVPILLGARVTRLHRDGGRVTGLDLATPQGERRIAARLGVVLAGGGFPASAALRAQYLPQPVAEHTAACESCTGTTLALAQQAGAAVGPEGEDNALWFPSSIARRDDGSTAVYPHIALDRSKPGLVAVHAGGLRFVDEAVSYHEFVRAMYRAHRSVPTIPAVLVCDRRFVWKYGLGLIRPRTPSLAAFVRRGYLFMADSIEDLARQVGVDPVRLAATVQANNADARTGVDATFGKGGTSYDRGNGDPEHKPNPCLGPIDRPPYCAVKVYPTPLGTSLGVRTDASARALDDAGRPIDGLYVVGNDMQSIMGGEYPGPGAQIGIAMTFGWIAAKHAAASAR
jgi:3-oxosteroid 1-dehydrogenase